MGAHPPPKAEVRGSNPLECAISLYFLLSFFFHHSAVLLQFFHVLQLRVTANRQRLTSSKIFQTITISFIVAISQFSRHLIHLSWTE